MDKNIEFLDIETIEEDDDAVITENEDGEWDEDLYGEDLEDEETDEEFVDTEIVGKNDDEDLQNAYTSYSQEYELLTNLLSEIIESGEITDDNKSNLNTSNEKYEESYITIKEEIVNAQNQSLEKRLDDLKNNMLTTKQEDVFNALTNNGTIQGLYKDENGEIYINAQFLQTRGLNVVNDDNKVTLKIDDDGNLTTSGDIVGGTITGAIMNAMTINTNTVNITSEDGGMTLEGALQKFSDENGNVRIQIGKDEDGLFKFILYGEDGETVLIDKNGIKTDAIQAGTINVDHLNANVINAIDAKIKNATIDKATIGELNATNAKIESLKSNKADIGDLNATNANIGTLTANVAKINTLLAGNITADNIQAGTITADKIATGAITAGSGIIADGAIGSAQISSLDASKITAGKIDTSKVEVAGANNHLRLKGNRLQVFQGTGSQAKERVSLGDVNGNGTVYGLRVRGADGKTVLLDENGVKSEGITDGAITNDKISDSADIDGAKLNINSVINKINDDGTETINGTKIEVEGQTLNVKLSTITNKQNADGEKITQAQSQITANTKAIGLKVDTQTYQTDKNNITTQMNKNTSAIDVMKDQIALKVEQTDINNAKSELEGSIDSKINSAKSEIKVTTDKISQNVSSLTNTVNKKADSTTVTTINNKVSSLETSVTGISQKVSSVESTTSSLNTKVNNAQSTADSAKTTATNAQSTANTANSTANANKGNISSLQTTVNNTSSKVSSLETNLSGITQRVSSTESSLTQTKKDLSNLEIGARNLLLATGTQRTVTGSNTINQCTSIYNLTQDKSSLNNQKLTLSFTYKVANYTGGYFKVQAYSTVYNSWNSITPSGNGTFTFKGTITVASNFSSNIGLQIRMDGFNGNITISNMKLEKGDRATDWTPAPEDVDNAISTVDGKVDTANKNISNLTSRVSTAESKLTKDSLTTTIGNHYTTKSEVEGVVTSKGYQTQSQVQQTVNSLQAKFTSSGGYNLLKNTGFKNGLNLWGTQSHNSPTGGEIGYIGNGAEWSFPSTDINTCQIRLSNQTSKEYGITQSFKTVVGKKYTVSFYYAGHRVPNANLIIRGTTTGTGSWLTSKGFNPMDYSGGKTSIDKWGYLTHTFTATLNSHTLNIVINNANDNGYLWIAQPQIEEGEMPTAYSPHTSEVYDGITQIDKDGIKVMQSGINGHTHMTSNGFYVNKGGDNVIKVTSDGVYVKGRVDITGGSVPTSSLSGTITSSQLNSTITGDINTAKNNASSALGTANTANNTANSASSKADKAKDAADKAQTSANSAQSAANDASGKADAAKDTANKAQATANAVNGTVNSNKDNWSNAYNRVKEWANGAVTGKTEINGGMIATNTITANKIAVGDFNNYSQLRKGYNLSNAHGTANWSSTNYEWYTSNNYFPITLDNTDNAFSTGDEITFKATIWIGETKNMDFGVWFYDANKKYICNNTTSVKLNNGWNTVNATIKLTHQDINKCPYMQILINNNGTYIGVKDVIVNRKLTGEFIVDGAINGHTITGAKIVGSTFSSTSGDFKVLDDGTVDATTLNADDEISTNTLNVEYISNTKYQAVIDRNYEVHINPWYDWESEGLEHHGHYKSLSSFIDACPRNLNGYNITVSIWSDLTESVNFNMFNNGILTLQLNGCTIYGYIVCNNHSMRYRIYGNNSSSTGTATVGSIMPNTGFSATGGYYSLMGSYTHLTVYDVKLYGGKASGNNNGLCITNLSKCYANNVQFIGCYSGIRSYSVSNTYVSSSSGLTSNVAFYAGSGSTIALNNTNQAGRSGSTAHTGSANNGQVLSTGATFSSSAVSGSNTTTSTPTVTKTATITANYGDTYRKTVYKNWKKDGSVRQGEWGGYGDCVGAWFFGEKISNYSDKNITGVSITIKRQTGGSSSAVTHTLKMHDYETRPSGSPTFRNDFSKDFSVATNKSTTINLTSAEITAFKKCKGLGLVPKAYNSTYYSVCSGSISVKITYKE
ncbi:beta strand repeat-containing protein [Terrisporobacter sp.]|uniref:beta strand repeat-containing protein n=1 Tax=Terrisporobacter sp. TaxID=1965305 RepID=UPI003992DD01